MQFNQIAFGKAKNMKLRKYDHHGIYYRYKIMNQPEKKKNDQKRT